MVFPSEEGTFSRMPRLVSTLLEAAKPVPERVTVPSTGTGDGVAFSMIGKSAGELVTVIFTGREGTRLVPF